MSLSGNSAARGNRALVQHSLISIVIPYLFVGTLSVYLHPLVLDGFFERPHGIHLLLLAAVAIGQVVSGNALMKERIVGFAPRLRELILFLLGSYVILLLVEGSVFRGEFQPLSGPLIYPLVLTVLQWLLGYTVHRSLKRREHFLSLAERKSGEALVRAVRDLSEEAGEADSGTMFSRRVVVLLQGTLLVVLFALLVAESSPRPIWIALAVAHFSVGYLCMITLNRYLEVNELLGSGVVPDAAFTRRRNGWAAVLLALALAVAIPLSRDGAIIPPERIGNALVSLNERLNRRTLQREMPGGLDVDMESAEGFGPDLEAATGQGQMQRNETIARIGRIVGLAIAAALGAGFLFFLIRPLLHRERGGSRFNLHPVARLRSLFQWLTLQVRATFRWFRERPGAVVRTARAMVENAREAQAERRERREVRSKERERQRKIITNTYVREMVRVTKWGAKVGIPYRKNEGAGSYCARLSQRYPEVQEELSTVRDVFERAIYSTRRISDDDVSRFGAAVKSVIRMRGQHGKGT